MRFVFIERTGKEPRTGKAKACQEILGDSLDRKRIDLHIVCKKSTQNREKKQWHVQCCGAGTTFFGGATPKRRLRLYLKNRNKIGQHLNLTHHFLLNLNMFL